MSTPVSVPQINKLLELLGNPSGEKFQYLLANGDLLKPMANADLSRVDRSAFGAMLTPTTAPIAWRPVNEYVVKILRWNTLRNWGLTKPEITAFVNSLVDHLDFLHPTGISLWLGRDLPFNWEEAMACLMLEVVLLGEKFKPYFESTQLSFFPGSEQSGGPSLGVALLDLQTYWNPTDGEFPDKVRGIEKRLPGLEVAWLLALNPELYLAIDYGVIPGLIAAGLVVESDSAPFFERGSDEAYVYAYRASYGWDNRSVVRFRE